MRLIASATFVLGNLTTENPFRRMVGDVHRSNPPIFFVADGYPGGTPAWVVRRAADLRRIYSDTEHFSVKGFSPLARMIGESWDLQQRQLREDPSLIPAAIQELLRAYSTVSTFRTCIKEVTYGAVTFKPGDKVAMSTTLGSCDPDEFDCPGEVRFDRKPNHLAFGTGLHFCIGRHLAIRELTIAMTTLLPLLPEFRPQPGVEILTDLGLVIQPRSLPLVFA